MINSKIILTRLNRFFLAFTFLASLLPVSTFAEEAQKTFNPIQVASPIMAIGPDARSAGMGDMGVATAPDANSQHWNAAKYPFFESKVGGSLSYIPWLKSLVNDVNIAYLSFYYKFDDIQTVSASLRYFSIGSMSIVNGEGIPITEVSPYEMAVDAAYARKFGEKFSLSLTLRYIRSDLTGGFTGDGGNQYTPMKPANVFGADVGVYFRNTFRSHEYALGLSLSNLGTKVSYAENTNKYFLPMTMRLGGTFTLKPNDANAFAFGVELSKLLVPTPPVRDTSLNVIKGRENDVTVLQGIFQSFYDAPYGISEELSEVMVGVGVEYSYINQFFVRGGYFHDSKRKGNRRYLTFGAGLKYSFLGLDVAYYFPFTANDPLSNTLRISLLFNIAEFDMKNRR